MKDRENKMDSGFSWVVLACSFLCQCCFSFLSCSCAILQVEIMEDLHIGSGVASTMTAFAVGMSTLLGPLSGVLSNLLSIRYTAFLGIILLSLGMLLASFSNNIEVMMFFYGIVTGVGFGIAYCPCVVIVSMYFDKRRIMANGVTFCAPGLGLLTIPYLVRYVIDNYGWRYSMAINAGIVLHALVFAAFFLPTRVERQRMVKPSCCYWRTGDAGTNGSDAADEDDLDARYEAKEIPKEIPTTPVSLGKAVFGSSSIGLNQKKAGLVLKNGSFGDASSLGSGRNLNLPLSCKTEAAKPYVPVYVNGTPEAKRLLRSPVTDFLSSESHGIGLSVSADDVHLESGQEKPFSDPSVSQFSSQSAITNGTENRHRLTAGHLSSTLPHLKPMRLDPLQRQRSLLGSGMVFASSEFGSAAVLPLKSEVLVSTEEVDIGLKATIGRVGRNKAMWIMCIHAFFFMSGCGMHSVHFPAYVASKGLSPHSVSLFYTVFGVALLCGRLFGAMIYNRIKPPLLALLFTLEMLNGLILGLAPFYASEPLGIFFLEGTLALMYGQSYMLQAPLVSQLVLVEDVPIAFGMIQAFNGLGYITSPILAGFIYDATHTYDIPMHMAGSFVIIGALTLLSMVFMTRKNISDSDNGKREEHGGERQNMKESSKNPDGKDTMKAGTRKREEEEEEEEVKPTKALIREVGKV